jgi:hypothetical protein
VKPETVRSKKNTILKTVRFIGNCFYPGNRLPGINKNAIPPFFIFKALPRLQAAHIKNKKHPLS